MGGESNSPKYGSASAVPKTKGKKTSQTASTRRKQKDQKSRRGNRRSPKNNHALYMAMMVWVLSMISIWSTSQQSQSVLDAMSIVSILSDLDHTHDWIIPSEGTGSEEQQEQEQQNQQQSGDDNTQSAVAIGNANRNAAEHSNPAAHQIEAPPKVERTIKVALRANTSTSGKPLVMITSCTRSLPNWQSVNETTLHKLLLPSLEKTVTQADREKFNFELLIAFDVGDTFWEDDRHRQQIDDSTPFTLNFISITKTKEHRIPLNEMCRAAYEYGADYIVRINDDSEFTTQNWATKGVNRLMSYNPPNIGVVGPTCKEGKVTILTHDMVHRSHLDIFGYYYPIEFDNWWIDDWITYVYGNNRTTKLADWKVTHHIRKHGTRYGVDKRQEQLLGQTLKRGKHQLMTYLQLGAANDPFKYSVLGTSRIGISSGPIQQTHERLRQENGWSPGKPLMIIATCTRSLSNWQSVNETTLHKLLLPSLEKTVTQADREKFNFELLIAFDVGDTFWEDDQHRRQIDDSTPFTLNFISITKTKTHRIPLNEMCRAAYEHGADYIVRINDDSEFTTQNWATKGVDRLMSYSPPNIGVVGPTCKEGKVTILTHDMVHRSHLDIFGYYYPIEFDNWWIDDWITYVYGSRRTTKLPDWTVTHHVTKHGTRYGVDRTQQGLLRDTIIRGKRTLVEYFEQNATKPASDYQVLGTSRIGMSTGPIHTTHARMKGQGTNQLAAIKLTPA